MLKNELGLLAQWVSSGVGQATLRKEIKRIQNSWTGVLLSGSKEEVIRRYFRYQQTVLLEISDETNSVHSPEFAGSVLELHDFLMRFFKRYLDADLKVPYPLLPGIRKRMNAAADQVSSVKDLELRSCLMDFVKDVERTVRLSCREQDYFFAVCHAAGQNEALDEVLSTMNFNHIGFCRRYQGQLEQQWAGLQSQERLAAMKKQMIRVKAMPLLSGLAYDPRLPSVPGQMEAWLTAVIHQETSQVQKLGLNITVAQLALLVRMLAEEGFFVSQSIAELLRFFAAHFTTKKQEHISYGSMNKLYYSADQFTAFAIRAMLQKMVGRINKMFFPN